MGTKYFPLNFDMNLKLLSESIYKYIHIHTRGDAGFWR